MGVHRLKSWGDNPVGRGLYKKTEVRYFSLQIKQAKLIKLKFIIWHLFILETNKKCMHNL